MKKPQAPGTVDEVTKYVDQVVKAAKRERKISATGIKWAELDLAYINSQARMCAHFFAPGAWVTDTVTGRVGKVLNASKLYYIVGWSKWEHQEVDQNDSRYVAYYHSIPRLKMYSEYAE